jgi:hypothetical protein
VIRVRDGYKTYYSITGIFTTEYGKYIPQGLGASGPAAGLNGFAVVATGCFPYPLGMRRCSGTKYPNPAGDIFAFSGFLLDFRHVVWEYFPEPLIRGSRRVIMVFNGYDSSLA